MSVRVEVWGDYACFSRCEFKVERVSYDIMTPSAARGILDAIYWHPGLRWHIDRIYVRNPIHFTSIRRNEVKSKALAGNIRAAMNSGAPLYLAASGEIQQRAALVLTNVRYVIEAHFTLTESAAPGDNAGKFQDIMKRRLSRGQTYHQPCFGVREFPAHFAPCEEIPPCPEPLLGEKDLGYMLYDMDFGDPEDIQPTFFRAVLRDGVLDLTNCEVVR